MNRTLRLLMVAAPLAAPIAALSANSNPDASFYKNAAEAGIAEVDEGQLAQDKGTNQEVKDFGARMVKDHGAANDKLKALAAQKNVELPTSTSVGQMALEAKLKVESGDTFDKAYIKSQVRAHEMAVRLFTKEANSGQDPDAKAFASSTLPTLQDHLKMARSDAADLGVTVK